MASTNFTRALPAYLGGKRRLAPLIFAELSACLPKESWAGSSFLDPMCGGGAVALWAKALGFTVTAGDAAERGAVVARSLVENSRVRLHRDDLVAALAEPVSRKGRRLQAPSPLFTQLQRDVLDRLLASADGSDDPRRSLLRLLVLKLALRVFPMSLPSATDAEAAARGDFERISSKRLSHYFRSRSRFGLAGLWKIAVEINAGVFGGTGVAYRGDAVTAIQSTTAEVLYLDPPYPGTTGYASTYAGVDALLGDHARAVDVPALTDLLDAAGEIPFVVLSYGGPHADLDTVVGLVSQFRTVDRALAIPYPRLRAIAKEVTNAESREILVVARR